MTEELQKRSKSQLLVSRDSKLWSWEGIYNPTLALLSLKSLQQSFGSVSCNFCQCSWMSWMVFGKEGRGETSWEQSHPHWPLLSGLVCFAERLNSVFKRLLFCVGTGILRDKMEICGVMSALHHSPGIFERWKDAKCKPRHWVEWVRTCGLYMWFCFLFKGGKKKVKNKLLACLHFLVHTGLWRSSQRDGVASPAWRPSCLSAGWLEGWGEGVSTGQPAPSCTASEEWGWWCGAVPSLGARGWHCSQLVSVPLGMAAQSSSTPINICCGAFSSSISPKCMFW